MFTTAGKEVGETVLYFGCRHKSEDYIYQEELEEAEKQQVLTQLNVAFSRDQEHKVRLQEAPAAHVHVHVHAEQSRASFSNTVLASKVYVQHQLKANKEHIWKLINSENAHIYICG